MNKFKSLSHLVVLLLILPGCIPPAHYMKRVPNFYSQRTISHNKAGIALTVHPLDNKESEKYFGRNILADGYFSFICHVENHTNKTYIIEPSYITIDLANPTRVAKLLHYDTSTHMTYANVFALLFAWPLIPFVIAPAGYSMYKTNKKITKNLRRNSISPRERIKIPPFATVDKFFFVHEHDFQSHFVIKLCEKSQDHHLLRFEINLENL